MAVPNAEKERPISDRLPTAGRLWTPARPTCVFQSLQRHIQTDLVAWELLGGTLNGVLVSDRYGRVLLGCSAATSGLLGPSADSVAQ